MSCPNRCQHQVLIQVLVAISRWCLPWVVGWWRSHMDISMEGEIGWWIQESQQRRALLAFPKRQVVCGAWDSSSQHLFSWNGRVHRWSSGPPVLVTLSSSMIWHDFEIVWSIVFVEREICSCSLGKVSSNFHVGVAIFPPTKFLKSWDKSFAGFLSLRVTWFPKLSEANHGWKIQDSWLVYCSTPRALCLWFLGDSSFHTFGGEVRDFPKVVGFPTPRYLLILVKL